MRTSRTSAGPYVSETLSVSLPKHEFPTKRSAKAWLRHEGFNARQLKDSGKRKPGRYWKAPQREAAPGTPKRMHPIGTRGAMLLLGLEPRSASRASIVDEEAAAPQSQRRKKSDALVLGALGLGGLLAANQMDALLVVRPLGVAPSTAALLITGVTAAVLHKKRPKASMRLVSVSAGIVAGKLTSLAAEKLVQLAIERKKGMP